MSISKFQLAIRASRISKKCLLRSETKLHVNLKTLSINDKRIFKNENKNIRG